VQLLAPCRLLCSLHAQVCASCQAARQVQPGLFDRLDTSQQIHRCLLICLASRVGHAGRMLLSSAICRLLCLLLCAQGLCNMSLQPGRYSLVSLTDLTHPNRCTDVYWYALNLVQVTGPCSCLLLSAGCCAVAACTGVCATVNTGGYRLQGLLHRSNTSKQSLGNSSVLLSSYCADAAVYGLFCSEYCCMHRVCASRKSDRY
jgi:hypothetical protein